MWFEAVNKNGKYPFNISDRQILSSDSVLTVNSIKDIKLFVLAQGKLTGYLTKITAAGAQITVYQDDQVLTTCTASLDGRVYGSDKIITQNSFIIFCDRPVQGTYNIPLLAETLCYVPKGLQLFCQSNPISRTAQTYQYDKNKCYLFNRSIRFLPGNNCNVFTQDGVVTFIGGTGNGLGRFSQEQAGQLWGITQVEQEEPQIKRGLLSINGQSPDIVIDTYSSIDIQQVSGPDSLVLKIRRDLRE